MQEYAKIIEAARLLNVDLMTKRKVIEKIYDGKLNIAYSEGAKVWYHYVPAKVKKMAPGLPSRINAISEEMIIEKLFDKLADKASGGSTLGDVYAQWMSERRADDDIEGHTVRDNERQWDKYMANFDISRMPIADITSSVLLAHFKQITKDRAMKKKAFLNLKSVCNGIWDYAIQHDMVTNNVPKSLPIKGLKFDVGVSKSNNTYTPEEREMLCDHLETSDDPNDLVIVLHFCLIARIGELRGLQWPDINFDRREISIHRMYVDVEAKEASVVKQGKLKQHTKNGDEEGNRIFPMSDRAYRVLSRLWEQTEDKEGFVFLYNGHPIKTQTVNSHLERACEYLDIRYISNHNIRATGATAALAEGMDEMTVKRLGGWKSLQTIQYYAREARVRKDIEEKYGAIFN